MRSIVYGHFACSPWTYRMHGCQKKTQKVQSAAICVLLLDIPHARGWKETPRKGNLYRGGHLCLSTGPKKTPKSAFALELHIIPYRITWRCEETIENAFAPRWPFASPHGMEETPESAFAPKRPFVCYRRPYFNPSDGND